MAASWIGWAALSGLLVEQQGQELLLDWLSGGGVRGVGVGGVGRGGSIGVRRRRGRRGRCGSAGWGCSCGRCHCDGQDSGETDEDSEELHVDWIFWAFRIAGWLLLIDGRAAEL